MLPRIPYAGCPLCEDKAVRARTTVDCSKHALYKDVLSPEMTWLECGACGHSYTEGYFSKEALAVVFSGTQESQKVGAAFEEQRSIAGRMIDKVLPYADRGDWCDVGFGSGALLFAAGEYGFSPCGIDLRGENVEILRSLGIEAHQVDLAAFAHPSRFSVVSLCDVLEHMPYPKASLAAARGLLAPDGVLLLSMPNLDSMAWSLLNSMNLNPYWAELEHYHNFGKSRLYALLAETGFEPLRYGISERYRVGMEVIARKKA